MNEITITPTSAPPVPINYWVRVIAWATLAVALSIFGWLIGSKPTPSAAPLTSKRAAISEQTMVKRDTGSHTPAMTPAISLKALEERYGIRIRLLGVTAAGGMVDFRYKIIDKGKATPLLQPLQHAMLIAEDGTMLHMASGHGMKHEQRLEEGVINFHFFANNQNAVKPGRPVTIAIGPVRVTGAKAQ